MFEGTYDIIDWKSCESYSPSDSSEDGKSQQYSLSRTYPFSGDDTTDIVFPKLFHEHHVESETSIVSIQGRKFHEGPLQFPHDFGPDSMEQQTVYQKVANWVLTQRKYFRNVEQQPIEDDEIEVINPVDLFHESILIEYLLITENDNERRALLRDFDSHRYHIESIAEAMQIHEYKFLRQPKAEIELELTPLITFHTLHKTQGPRLKRKRKDSSSTDSSYVEKAEEHATFLGVPRLLENYLILNREGYMIKPDTETDLWLSPMKEDIVIDEQEECDQFDMEFLSSWFSDVYQTGINTDETRTSLTVNTDILEKVTVISVSHGSEEEVWVDAPDIPHWLDEEHEELELFNQPSRPLYYYRDRIKGCYRIIGVEDETVVLFSGNDDDTIFYDEEGFREHQIRGSTSNSSPDSDRLTTLNVRRPAVNRQDSDRKNDSGIEDIDDIISEEIAIASISLSNEEAKKLGYKTVQKPSKNVSFRIHPGVERSIGDYLFVVVGAMVVFLSLILYGIIENKYFTEPKVKL